AEAVSKLLAENEVQGTLAGQAREASEGPVRDMHVLGKKLKEGLSQAPFAYNVLPFIDSEMGNGSSREEWKADVEARKILGAETAYIPVDGLCVRVPSLRSHCHAATIKLRKGITLEAFTQAINNGGPFVKVIANTKEQTLGQLTPVSVSETLEIRVGRIKKLL